MLDVLQEQHVWALRADHPAASFPLSLAQLADLPHLVRIVPGDEDAGSELPAAGRGLQRRAIQDDDGAFARALAGIGRQRSVLLTIPDSYAALAIVGESDLAALVPSRMAHALAGRFKLRLFDPPYHSPPVWVSMVWDLGYGASPAMTWMRTLIHQVAQSIEFPPPSQHRADAATVVGYSPPSAGPSRQGLGGCDAGSDRDDRHRRGAPANG